LLVIQGLAFKEGGESAAVLSADRCALNKYGTEWLMSEDNATPPHVAPPAASGPAGALFEGKVGAF
jgi:hypothetical protein